MSMSEIRTSGTDWLIFAYCGQTTRQYWRLELVSTALVILTDDADRTLVETLVHRARLVEV